MDLICNLAAILLIGYWLLWMLGVRLPGVGKERFTGWHCRRWSPASSESSDVHLMPSPTVRGTVRVRDEPHAGERQPRVPAHS